MKIKITDHTMEIDADARELRESNTLAGNLVMMINKCFQSSEQFDDEEEEEDETDV